MDFDPTSRRPISAAGLAQKELILLTLGTGGLQAGGSNEPGFGLFDDDSRPRVPVVQLHPVLGAVIDIVHTPEVLSQTAGYGQPSWLQPLDAVGIGTPLLSVEKR